MGLLKSFFGSPASNKQPRYASLFQGRTLTGMVSNRAVFHDPSDITTERFYGGRPDAIFNGSNVELTNSLTIIRAYGTSAWSSFNYPTPPLRAFSFQQGDGSVQVLVDTVATLYLDNQNGTATSLLTKSPGAGQGYFVAVGNVCYYGNGVDTIKYTPWNVNGTTWKWGIAAPASAPKVTIIPAGTNVQNWAASTVFSTMGLLVDPNNNIQQLTSINNGGQNVTPYGSSGDGAPAFNTTIGSSTTDNQIHWTCLSQITLWNANTVYVPNSVIYDPVTNCLFTTANGNTNFTSGFNKPTFNNSPVIYSRTPDGTGSWQALGTVQTIQGSGVGTYGFTTTPTVVTVWAHNTRFNFYSKPSLAAGNPSYVQAAICYPAKPWYDPSTGLLNGGTALYLFGATGGTVPGLTANTTYNPWNGISSQPVGTITHDGDLQWTNQGNKAWQANHQYTQWDIGTALFSVVLDTNSNLQVCISSGLSGSSNPSWATTYGTQTNDGTVTWACVGGAISWHSGTQWYFPEPPNQFTPPNQNTPFGGADVIGSGFVQTVINNSGTGTSGGTQPTWPTTPGNTVTDGSITWETVGPYSTANLVWFSGHTYAYSYKCRTPTDYYVSNIPPGLSAPNGPYRGGGTGVISTASPTTTITGANSGAVNQVRGVGSTDPQVDTIVIWRDADGGGPSNMFELTEFPAPQQRAGSPQPIGPAHPIPQRALQSFINARPAGWVFYDFLPDVPTISGGVSYPGLNNLVPAPIDDTNNPPPAAFKPMAWHFQRIWGGNGTTVQFTGGPDVITGNANEAFNPGDEFPFLWTVVNCIHTPAGLIVILPTDIQAIYGGPATGSFYSTTLFPGKGCASFNAMDFIGGEIYMLSSDSQCIVITPSLQMSRIGWPIADKIIGFDASKAYLTVHDQGNDNAVYLSDGSTGFFRLNPHQAPQGDAVWSPFRTIGASCKLLQSVVTSATQRVLFIGSNNNNAPILKRDQSVFTDLVASTPTAFDANYEIGAITLSDPGQTAVIKFIELDFAGVGSIPTVQIALDDPRNNPTWVTLTTQNYDPPQVYGDTITPPYFPVRYNLPPALAECRRIRIKIDYGTDTVGNELYSFAIFGKLKQES